MLKEFYKNISTLLLIKITLLCMSQGLYAAQPLNENDGDKDKQDNQKKNDEGTAKPIPQKQKGTNQRKIELPQDIIPESLDFPTIEVSEEMFNEAYKRQENKQIQEFVPQLARKNPPKKKEKKELTPEQKEEKMGIVINGSVDRIKQLEHKVEKQEKVTYKVEENTDAINSSSTQRRQLRRSTISLNRKLTSIALAGATVIYLVSAYLKKK